MILFDWIFVALFSVIVAGSVAFGLISARQEKDEVIQSLREELEHQRGRKRFWKAKALGRRVQHATAE